MKHPSLIALSLIVISVLACKTGTNTNSNRNGSSNRSSDTPGTPSTETGVEKIKPAPGTGNVQGKVLYNSKPAANIEVTLCEKFNRFFGGCDGQKYLARTDADGEYVITNVPPNTYEALTARVFETKFYVFATTGITGLASAKYDVVADKTLFVTPTNLFKSDLKTLNPKAGEKVSSEKLELRWAAYPDAAYYKFSIYPDDVSVTSPYINERVEATSFAIDKPLQKGTYRWQVEAYNDDKVKLAESDRDIKFTIIDQSH
jgi:hypothetical protein